MAPERIRSALFLDFDNVFGGLLDLEPTAAIAFAREPREWLRRLATVDASGCERRYLIRRCYMNPAGSRVHASLGPDRVFFSLYRPFFVKAGFEVVDCPSLTYRHKNAADIRICLDVIDTLSRATRYDEYVIASGDSDFTPLMQRLRAADRRIIVVASSQTAVAYESVADLLIGEQQVIELMTGIPEGSEDAPAPPPIKRSGAEATGNGSEASTTSLASSATSASFRELVEAAVQDADAPLNLASLGIQARSVLGGAVDESDWFGHRTLTKAIQALQIPGVVVSGHHVWVEGRHEKPEVVEVQSLIHLPELVARVSTLADVPRLDAGVWPRVFDTLAGYAAGHDFNLTECTRWARDQLAAGGFEVGRQAVARVVWGARYGGCPVHRVPAPAAVELATAFIGNTVKRAAAAGLHLSPEEVQELRDWVYPGSSLGELGDE